VTNAGFDGESGAEEFANRPCLGWRLNNDQ